MSDIKNIAQRALKLMDLTSLTNTETDQEIIALCQQAKSPAGETAAICIFPRFIPVAKKALKALESLGEDHKSYGALKTAYEKAQTTAENAELALKAAEEA